MTPRRWSLLVLGIRVLVPTPYVHRAMAHPGVDLESGPHAPDDFLPSRPPLEPIDAVWIDGVDQ